MRKDITIRDIAEAAGVSHAAVSRVLNGRPIGIRVSSATSARILAIARQSGYRPNRVARDMALRRETTLGLVLASGGDDISDEYLPAMDAVLAAAGYRLLLMFLPGDPSVARDRVTSLLHDGIAGVLCSPGVMPMVIQVVSGDCPVVAAGQGAGEAMLRALGVAVPVTVTPPPSVKQAPAVSPIAPPLMNPRPVVVLPPVVPPPQEVTKPNPPPDVVAPVTGGTVSEPVITPAPEPELAPVISEPEPPVVTPLNVETPVTAPEPEPVPVSEPGPAPIVDEPTNESPVTESSPAVVAAVPGGTESGISSPGEDTSSLEPVPEPVITPAPEPEPEIDPGPVIIPDPVPVIVPEATPIETSPVDNEPTNESPVTESSPAVVAAVPGGTVPSQDQIEEPVTPAIVPEPGITPSQILEPEPPVTAPVIAEPPVEMPVPEPVEIPQAADPVTVDESTAPPSDAGAEEVQQQASP